MFVTVSFFKKKVTLVHFRIHFLKDLDISMRKISSFLTVGPVKTEKTGLSPVFIISKYK